MHHAVSIAAAAKAPNQEASSRWHWHHRRLTILAGAAVMTVVTAPK